MSKLPSVSVSELSMYLCPRQGAWSYIYSPKIPPAPLWLGTCLHIGLEAFYQNRNFELEVRLRTAWSKMEKWAQGSLTSITRGMMPEYARVRKEEFAELFDLATGMLKHYAEVQAPNLVGNVVGIERKIQGQVTLRSGLSALLRGKLDLILETDDGIIIVDHKAYSKPPDPDIVRMDLQLIAYAWLYYRDTGIVASTVGLNILYKGVPERPALLKSGLPSRSKSQYTTGKLYRELLDELKLDRLDYSSLLDHFDTIGMEQFFGWAPVSITEERLLRFETELPRRLEAVLEARQAELPIAIPSQYGLCKFCDFKQICRDVEEFGLSNEMSGFAGFTKSSL